MDDIGAAWKVIWDWFGLPQIAAVIALISAYLARRALKPKPAESAPTATASVNAPVTVTAPVHVEAPVHVPVSITLTSPAAAAAVAPPPDEQVFHVPYARNDFFRDRDAQLAGLEPLSNGAGRPLAVLAGIGGVGKSAVALEFAYRQRPHRRVVWWVEAETTETRNLSYARFAAALKLPENGSPYPDVIRGAVLNWLENHDDWLLVLDNVETPQSLTDWLPVHRRGLAVITSRETAWPGGARLFPVTEWAPETAAAFLAERSGIKNDPATARSLAERLGCLPLACEQAGAGIRENRWSFATYLSRFDAECAGLAAKHAPVEHPSLFVTVQMAMQAVAADPLAATVAQALAQLAPDDIPRSLLAAWPDVEDEAMDGALQALFRRALIRGENDLLSMHRLTQEMIRAQDPDPAASAGRAVGLLADTLDKGNMQIDLTLWPMAAALLPHGAALFGRLPVPPPRPDAAGFVCGQLGAFMQFARSDIRGAQIWAQRAVDISEAVLSADHPNLAACYSNLAVVLRALKEYPAAADLYRKALVINERVSGRDSVAAARIHNNLGGLLLEQLDLDGAQVELEAALGIFEKNPDADRSFHARVCHNLGSVFWRKQELPAAKQKFKQALEIKNAHYHGDHPEIAMSLHGLGVVSFKMNEWDAARDLAACAVAMLEILAARNPLSPDHPDLTLYRADLKKIEAAMAARAAAATPEK